ncbi:MAG: acetolactate decarboxylase [Flavobacterium sp.]|nr:acetolactate decarboxylase [Flavobacterium sp.]
MKDVMKKGMLHGTIALDTISNKTNLYGLGPVEYLTGEIMIIDGKSYISTISNGAISVTESFNAKAPFFVAANVARWKESPLPDSVNNISDLNRYLDILALETDKPFAFKLAGKIKSAVIHVVNLPPGTKVTSHDDAHTGMVKFELDEQNVEIIGFFSRNHQAVFTHHDTFIHLHLLTVDKKFMGHLEDFAPMEMTLFLAE